MQPERVILVNGSRLLRDLLKSVIKKFTDFEIERELSEPDELLSIIKETKAGWLFIVLPPDESLPEDLVTKLLLHNPTLRILSFWTDGSHVNMEWLGRQRRDFTELTLEELAQLLHQELWANATKEDHRVKDN